MIWILLYVYLIGVLNDFMYAISLNADLKDWRIHANIALWPFSVPVAIIIAMFMEDEG